MALGGQVGKINDEWRAGRFILVVSEEIVSEYSDVLKRPKLHLKSRTIAAIVNGVYRKADFVAPEEKILVVLADTSDNKLLEAAIAGSQITLSAGTNMYLTSKNSDPYPSSQLESFSIFWKSNDDPLSAFKRNTSLP